MFQKCPGVDEVCCQASSDLETITITNYHSHNVQDEPDTVDKTNPENERLAELESDVNGALERVREGLEEVKGNEKAVSLLEKIRSTLESVLDKLSTLMEKGSVAEYEVELVTKNALDLLD